MPEEPEQDRLRDRLDNWVREDGTVTRATMSHGTWGPGAEALTAEERAAIVNRMLDADAEDAKHTVRIRVSELRMIYKALSELSEIGRINVHDWLNGKIPEEVLSLRRKVGSLAEFPAIHAGQNLPRKVCEEVRRELGQS